MPHAGNPAPVLFRRDWNLNVFNNNAGFSNRYLWKPRHVTTGFGTLIEQFTWDMGPATRTAFSIMTWTSAPIPTFGFVYTCTLTCEIRPGGKTYLKQVNVFEQHVGIIYQGDVDRVGSVYPNMDDTEGAGVTVSFDPHFYDADPRYFGGPFKKKLWTDGPPH